MLIEPAQTDTDMWRTAGDMVLQIEAEMSPEHRDLYAEHIAGMKKFVPTARKMASPTTKVVTVVEEALTARRPRGALCGGASAEGPGRRGDENADGAA